MSGLSFCRFVFLSGLMLGLGYPLTPVAAAAQIEGQLIVEDILARPGTPVTLEALLIEQGLLGHKGLGGEAIVFEVEGSRAGTALTGGDGRAFLEYKTHLRGNHPIKAIVENSPRVAPVDGLGNLASWERRRPILLVDVSTLMQRDDSIVDDDLVKSLPELPFVASLQAFGSPREDASHALVKLVEFYYNVLYLHEHQDTALHETRAWLRQHHFPVGIVRMVPQESKALLALMEELKEGGWDNLEAGIGQTWDFAQTLVKQRLKTVIFPEPTEKKTYPHRARVVQEWKEVRQHL